MLINRIQASVFRQLCERQNMDRDEYVRAYSEHYLGRPLACLENLTEEDGDQWITNAYFNRCDDRIPPPPAPQFPAF